MLHLSETIDFELAKLLDNRIYADMRDDRYAAEDVIVTWDNYLGSKKYKEGEYIADGDYIHGKTYYAPIYAEVIDWLFDKGIVIEFNPAFTFALNEHIAYYYSVYSKKEDSLFILFTTKLEMSSFKLAMKEIVTKLIEMNLI